MLRKNILKIISLLLICVLLCGLCACGKKSDETSSGKGFDTTSETESSKNESSETNEHNEAETKLDFEWDLKEIKTPTLAEIKVSEQGIKNTNIKVKVGETPFNYSLDNFLTALRKSNFLMDKYNVGISELERIDGETYTEGDMVNYELENSIVGVLKTQDENYQSQYFNDLSVTIKQYTKYYTNPHSISFAFHGVDLNKNTQKELFNFVQDCIGKEYAEFLLYGKDSDGKKSDGKSVDDGSMNESVTVGETVYIFNRTLDLDKENPEENAIYVSMYVSEPGYYNSFVYVDGNHKSMYEDFKYKLPNFISNITDFSATSFKGYAKEYLKDYGVTGEYSMAVFDYAWFEKTKMDDGREKYYASIDVQRGCSDISKVISPKFEIDYTIFEKDGEIVDLEFEAVGAPGMMDDESKASAYKQLLDMQKKQISFLFPGINIDELKPEIVTDTENNSQSTTGKYVLMGKECDFNVEIAAGESMVDLYTGEWDIDFNYNKK